MPKKMVTVVCFFLTTGALVSCSKTVEKKSTKSSLTTTSYEVPPTTTTAPTPTSTATTTPAPSLFNLNVNWNSTAAGAYGYAQSLIDFKSVSFWGGDAYRSQVSNGMLKTTLKANALHEGGVISRVNVSQGTEYELSYDMMFDNNFDFSFGGKVGFGFLIGAGYTGGVPGTDGNGGSFRLMWNRTSSNPNIYLKPYVYYKDQPGTYGNDFGVKYPASGSISKGVWYNVKMYMKSNTGSNTDGRIRLVINGTTVMDQAIRWTTNDINRMVKNVCFETFRGGGETYWQSSTDGSIYFDNVVVNRLQ